MKFHNLSPHEDFNSKFQSDLLLINKNILYITHEVDQIKRIVQSLENATKLQTQVDDFYNSEDSAQEETRSAQ